MPVDREIVAAGLFDALKVASVELRERLPDIFERVDRIKNAPGWVAFSTINHSQTGAGFNRFAWVECLWCGDDFVAMRRYKPGTGKFCSIPCSNAMKGFRKRRARTKRKD